MQPIIQTLPRVRTENRITLKLEHPLHARQELVVEPQVRQQPVHILLALDAPRVREDHEVQLPRELPVLDGGGAADGQHACCRADEEETPVGRHDGHHVEEVGDEVRDWAGLD